MSRPILEGKYSLSVLRVSPISGVTSGVSASHDLVDPFESRRLDGRDKRARPFTLNGWGGLEGSDPARVRVRYTRAPEIPGSGGLRLFVGSLQRPMKGGVEVPGTLLTQRKLPRGVWVVVEMIKCEREVLVACSLSTRTSK